MPVIIAKFLFPYISMLSNASWSIMQNFEGAGIISSAVLFKDSHSGILGSTWFPEAKVNIIIFIISILFLLWLPVLTLSGYSLNKWKGIFIVFSLILFPGVLTTLGLYPLTSMQPEKYVIGGAGEIGYVRGLLPLAFLMVLVGWSLVIIFVDSFRMGKRFIDIYDHLWLISGLVALIFFVIDAQAANNTKDYNETNSNIQRANSYLLKQIELYGQWCTHGLNANFVSCTWASDLHQRLLDASITGLNAGRIFGMESTAEFYSRFGQAENTDKVSLIREEIIAYNRSICPIVKLNEGGLKLVRTSIHCQRTPSEFCMRFAEPLNGIVDDDIAFTPVALATECIIPDLIYQQKHGLEIASQVLLDRISKNYRWMYNVFFMLVLGGKIATTSVKLVGMESRNIHDTQRTLNIIQKFVFYVCFVAHLIFYTVSVAFRFFRSMVYEGIIYIKFLIK